MADTLEQAQADGRAPWTVVLWKTTEYTVFEDGFPVTPGHCLFVPKENTAEAISRCVQAAIEQGNINVTTEGNDITGYNIGLNIGESAGQTCMYPHVHLIYRRDGDCDDPVGGVRNVIPGKGNYKKSETNIDFVGDIIYGDGC